MGATFDPFLRTMRKKDVANVGDAASICLGPCSGLGYASSSSGPVFSWIDPDDVVLNGATLGTWGRTVLVRKAGSYPTAHDDGMVVAETSAEDANKNYYRDHNFVDTTQEAGTTYYYQLFSMTTSQVWNNLVANRYSSGTGLSWPMVQQFVRAGRGAELFPVGTVFYVDHAEYGHEDGTGLWFRVAGHDQVAAADETLLHTMCLDMVDCLFNSQYDAPEEFYALTADETAQAGRTYYTLDGSTYTALTEGTDYEVGDTVPVASWYQRNVDQNRASYGSNNPVQSNLIQWANSSGTANGWFTKQTLFDKCTSNLVGKNGFCKHLDPEFLAVVKEAKITTARSGSDGGGSVEHTAKFWPLSMTQVFGSANNNIPEGVRLDFYKDGGSPLKTLRNSTSATNWWLRSPLVGNSNFVCYVNASGASTRNYAHTAYGVSLACIIA